MIDPLLSQIVAYGFGLLFISSAWNKLSDIDQFSLILKDYQLPMNAITEKYNKYLIFGFFIQ